VVLAVVVVAGIIMLDRTVAAVVKVLVVAKH
jgi:hypothetical protein